MRKIVCIDEQLCNGCGECIPSCAEGALKIIDGKAKLLREDYCDGLGACLGHCPQGAIHLVEKEAEIFDDKAVHARVLEKKPSSLITKSSFKQWPVQLSLVPVKAPFFDDCDLLVIADCVPLVYPKLHSSLLYEKSVVIGCPKFDDVVSYTEKLTEILKRNKVNSVTIAYMEVPCCSGLVWMVKKAIAASGKNIPVEQKIITITGEIK